MARFKIAEVHHEQARADAKVAVSKQEPMPTQSQYRSVERTKRVLRLLNYFLLTLSPLQRAE